MTSEFPDPPPVDLSAIKTETDMPTGVRPNPQASHEPTKLEKLFKPTPRPRETKAAKPKTPTPAMPKAGFIAERLSELYVGMAIMISPMDQVCAEAVMKAAPECGKAMEQLCKENPAVRRIVLKLIETSTLGKVVVAHLPILMVVATHHVPAFQSMAGKMMANDVEDNLRSATEGEAA